MARLPPAAQQAQYEAMVSKVTGVSAPEQGVVAGLGGGGGGGGGGGPSTSSSPHRGAAVLGLHLAIALGTGFACGHALGRRLLGGDSGALAGGLVGLALALVVEVGLLLARAAGGGGDGGSAVGGRAHRRPAWVPPSTEQLAAEAAVADAVVAGAATRRGRAAEVEEGEQRVGEEVKKER